MKSPTTPCESEETDRKRMEKDVKERLRKRRMKREGFSKPRKMTDGSESDRW